MASKESKKMEYTFRQQHFAGLIQRRLDYIFISHNFQEVVKYSEILCVMSTDHSAFFCSFQHFNKFKKGSGLWKFIMKMKIKDTIQKCKEHIQKVKEQLNSQTQFCDQTKWEILKYEICLFIISFLKNLAQLRRKEPSALENRL